MFKKCVPKEFVLMFRPLLGGTVPIEGSFDI